MRIPAKPKIYHITHVDNLAMMVENSCIWSDARRLEQDRKCTIIGMSEIKRRRLQEIEVTCHPGTRVGDYVPFYFCPRSIMLYILHMGNHPDLEYQGGQSLILHLEADLHRVVEWASRNSRSWAFTDRNAGMYVASFYNNLRDLEHVKWNAVAAKDWQDSVVKEGKQAEFLVHDTLPWEMIEQIGVINKTMKHRVEQIIGEIVHKPLVRVRRNWYY
jgi:hypothetical protein